MNACKDPLTGVTAHAFYVPHGAALEVCARCAKVRAPKPPEFHQPPPRPFLDLVCE